MTAAKRTVHNTTFALGTSEKMSDPSGAPMPEPTIRRSVVCVCTGPFDRHTPIRPPRVSATIPNRMLRTAGPQP